MIIEKERETEDSEEAAAFFSSLLRTMVKVHHHFFFLHLVFLSFSLFLCCFVLQEKRGTLVLCCWSLSVYHSHFHLFCLCAELANLNKSGHSQVCLAFTSLTLHRISLLCLSDTVTIANGICLFAFSVRMVYERQESIENASFYYCIELGIGSWLHQFEFFLVYKEREF